MARGRYGTADAWPTEFFEDPLAYGGEEPRRCTAKRWLDGRGVPFFTPSRAKARANFDALNALREELGLEQVRGAGDNPMIFFTMPSG